MDNFKNAKIVFDKYLLIYQASLDVICSPLPLIGERLLIGDGWVGKAPKISVTKVFKSGWQQIQWDLVSVPPIATDWSDQGTFVSVGLAARKIFNIIVYFIYSRTVYIQCPWWVWSILINFLRFSRSRLICPNIYVPKIQPKVYAQHVLIYWLMKDTPD